MIKYLFALSTLGGLAGLVVTVGACSDNAAETAVAPTDPQDAGTPKAPKTPAPKTPAPSDDDQGGDGTQPATTCMETTPFDATKVPYNPPAVKAGSCTAADIKVFDDFIQNNPQGTFEDLKAALTKQSKRCGDCAFGSSDDATWAPVVLDGTTATLNGGGCVSVASGKDACGKAYQQWNTCLNEVCAACTDQADNTQCKDDAQQVDGPCGTATKALIGSCGNNVNDYLKTCFSKGIGGVLEQLCGSPSKDAGK